VEEAGGQYTDMLGNRVEYGHAKSEQDKFAILGSNGLLHATVLHHFEKVRKDSALQQK